MNTHKFWPLDSDMEGEIYENVAWDLPGFRRDGTKPYDRFPFQDQAKEKLSRFGRFRQPRGECIKPARNYREESHCPRKPYYGKSVAQTAIFRRCK